MLQSATMGIMTGNVRRIQKLSPCPKCGNIPKIGKKKLFVFVLCVSFFYSFKPPPLLRSHPLTCPSRFTFFSPFLSLPVLL